MDEIQEIVDIENKQLLYHMLVDAHLQCCKRQNISSLNFVNSYTGSGSNVIQAVIAGLSTFGRFHAPVEQTFELLSFDYNQEIAESILEQGGRIPGWGSEFVKGLPDPIFTEIHKFLIDRFNDQLVPLVKITSVLHAGNKYIYPNASAYTALVGKILGYTCATIMFLLIECRLSAWRETIKLYSEKGEYLFLAEAEKASRE